MRKQGSNLAHFQSLQLDFAAHIRHPDRNPIPRAIEPRRMQIYIDLVYNNIENFLSNTFRVTRKITSDEIWHAMVRDFVHRHASTSQYFLEIPQEFLAYLDAERDVADDPPFLLELCHYEWVELAVDVSAETLPAPGPRSELLDRALLVSPLAWPLRYAFPVHQIGPSFQPATAPREPTYLVVYRDRADRVRFMESNVVTARLLELVGEGDSARAALHAIASELGRDRDPLVGQGTQILEQLIDCDIITAVQ